MSIFDGMKIVFVFVELERCQYVLRALDKVCSEGRFHEMLKRGRSHQSQEMGPVVAKYQNILTQKIADMGDFDTLKVWDKGTIDQST